MRSMQILAVITTVVLASTAASGAEAHRAGKSPVRAAGHVVGGVVAEPGCDAGVECGECCSGCGGCSIGLIPAVVHGIDCLLNKIFCSHRCDPCGGPVACMPSQRFYPSNGCDDGCTGRPLVLPKAPDPFIEDPVPAPLTKTELRSYRLWDMQQPARYQTLRRGSGEYSIYSGANATPRPLSIPKAEPLKTSTNSTRTLARGTASVRTASDESRESTVPQNPLRK
jgi:hypothetical protein